MANHAIDHALGGEEKEWSGIAWKRLAWRVARGGARRTTCPSYVAITMSKEGARWEALDVACEAAKGRWQAVRTAEDATQTDAGLVPPAADRIARVGMIQQGAKHTQLGGIILQYNGNQGPPPGSSQTIPFPPAEKRTRHPTLGCGGLPGSCILSARLANETRLVGSSAASQTTRKGRGCRRHTLKQPGNEKSRWSHRWRPQENAHHTTKALRHVISPKIPGQAVSFPP